MDIASMSKEAIILKNEAGGCFLVPLEQQVELVREGIRAAETANPSSREPDPPPATGSATGMLLFRRLGPLDFPKQYLLRHQPLRRIRIAAAGVDGVQADVQDVPAAQAPALFRERAQIGLHPLGVG